MLLNKKAVRAKILDRVKKTRPGWECTRVSESVLLQLDIRLNEIINRAVGQHPSRGKTFVDFI